MPTPPRILLVEDDRNTAQLIQQVLHRHFGDGSVQIAASIEAAVARDPASVDLVLSDMHLPDGSALRLLEDFLIRRPDLPVVIVTVDTTIDTAIRAIQMGACDYIVKTGDYLFAVPLVVEKNLAIWQVKQDNRRLEEELRRTLEQLRLKNRQLESMVRQLESAAATDPLTGLANRRAFSDALTRSFAEALRYQQDLSCIMLDLDGFKQVNDTLGHQRGDDVLRHAAAVLRSGSRSSDLAARYGGDEFVLLLPRTGLDTALFVAERLFREFARMVEEESGSDPRPLRVTTSIGVSSLSASHPAGSDELLSHADHALYRAKQLGRARVVGYHPDGMQVRVVGEPAAAVAGGMDPM